MNPKEIGSLDAPQPAPIKEDISVHENKVSSESNVENPEENENESGFVPRQTGEVDETVLVNQEFLLDPDLTVREFLVQNSVEVVDFVRFECGEEATSESSGL